jgi:hypothetical protein
MKILAKFQIMNRELGIWWRSGSRDFCVLGFWWASGFTVELFGVTFDFQKVV